MCTTMFLLALALSLAVEAADSWSTVQHDSLRTGFSTVNCSSPPSSAPRQLWMKKSGRGVPVTDLAGTTVFTVATSVLRGYDTASGTQTFNDVADCLLPPPEGSTNPSVPLVTPAGLYTCCYPNVIWIARNGTLLNYYQVDTADCMPVLVGATVYVGTKTQLFAFSEDLTLKWTAPIPFSLRDWGGSASPELSSDGASGLFVPGWYRVNYDTTADAVMRLDAGTGVVVWRLNLDPPRSAYGPSISVDLAAPAAGGATALYVTGRVAMHVVDASSGKIVASYPLPAYHGKPAGQVPGFVVMNAASAASVLLLLRDDGIVEGVDAAKLTQLWKYEQLSTFPPVWASGLIDGAQRAFVLTRSNTLACLAVATGVVTWTIPDLAEGDNTYAGCALDAAGRLLCNVGDSYTAKIAVVALGP